MKYRHCVVSLARWISGLLRGSRLTSYFPVSTVVAHETPPARRSRASGCLYQWSTPPLDAPVIGMGVLVGTVLLVAAGCGENSSQEEAADREEDAARLPIIAVVNEPLRSMASMIGGEYVTITFNAPSDIDPAFWSPTPDELKVFQDADLVLRHGAGYANWIDAASISRKNIVNTSRAFNAELITSDESATHSHGTEGEHAHRAVAFTTWLDPDFALLHAAAIHEALTNRWGDHEASFKTNFASLEQTITDWAAALDDAAGAVGDQPMLGSHPVYQYLAARYDWEMESVHWEPEEMPDDAAWSDFEKLVVSSGARLMLWEGEPAAAIRSKLESMGITIVIYEPCFNTPEDTTFFDVMNANAANLRAAASR